MSAAWHPEAVLEPRFRWSFPDSQRRSLRTSLDAALGARPRRADDRAPGPSRRHGRGGPRRLVRRAAGRPPRPAPAARRRPRCSSDSAGPATRGERVMVFGDFDADGLDGLAILVLALRRFGLDVEPYVPSRLDEGHGLSLAAVDAAVARRRHASSSRSTAGSSSATEIARRGRSRHRRHRHRPPPRAAAVAARRSRVVNPHRADSRYPDARLAGSGVAFKVAQLLLRDEPGGIAAALDLADLATIGTVADVAPIVGENRAIARLGLERLRHAPRPGIAALLERARVAPAAVDLDTIAFALAPRLNAAGTGGGGARGRPAAARRGRREAAAPRRRPRGRQQDPPRPDDHRGRRGAGARGRGPGSSGGHRPRALAGRHRRARRRAPGRGPRAARRSSGPTSATRSAPRAGATGRSTSARRSSRARDLFTRHGGHAGAAGFELPAERWPAFVERFEAIARGLRAARPAGGPGHRPRAPGARRRLRPVPRARRRSRRTAPATRSRSSRSSA